MIDLVTQRRGVDTPWWWSFIVNPYIVYDDNNEK